ncbi:hypothetical protein Agub_g7096 [Astrephomene gubernaculifera]|uniref:SBP-type domain-containing protein n=1 Tax=Astrephomene gubernaculifera TaxID=47775 RepID=A0AAD3HM08_9CHLO|nr:hypothetical protein Agub_g7096 [Astrephomene gubernaculifera]
MEDTFRTEGDPGGDDWQPAHYVWDSRRLAASRIGVATGHPGEVSGNQPIEAGHNAMEDGASGEQLQGLGEKCMVRGCTEDLSNSKPYYRRFRICERHLKTLTLCIEGKPSRFYQQCGRFHGVEEFEGGKR